MIGDELENSNVGNKQYQSGYSPKKATCKYRDQHNQRIDIQPPADRQREYHIGLQVLNKRKIAMMPIGYQIESYVIQAIVIGSNDPTIIPTYGMNVSIEAMKPKKMAMRYT